MNNAIAWFKDEEAGQGLAEYGLIIALIAVVCIAALEAMGIGVMSKLNQINEKLKQYLGFVERQLGRQHCLSAQFPFFVGCNTSR